MTVVLGGSVVQNLGSAWGFAGAALLGGTLASTLGARGVFAVSGVALALVALVAGFALLRLDPRPATAHSPLPA